MTEETRKLGKEILQGNDRTVVKEIDLTSVDKRYIGDFTFVTPSLMDRMRVGVIKSGMIRGVPEDSLDVMSQNIAHMSATLAVVCKKHPDWFDLDKIGDYIVLETVYDTFLEWENSFRTRSSEDNDGDDSTGSD